MWLVGQVVKSVFVEYFFNHHCLKYIVKNISFFFIIKYWWANIFIDHSRIIQVPTTGISKSVSKERQKLSSFPYLVTFTNRNFTLRMVVWVLLQWTLLLFLRKLFAHINIAASHRDILIFWKCQYYYFLAWISDKT